MTFDLDVAKKIGLLCWLVYWVETSPSYIMPNDDIIKEKNYRDAIQTALKDFDLELIDIFKSDTENYAILVKEDNSLSTDLFLSFSGTYGIDTFIEDLEFLMVNVKIDDNNFYINKGFHNGYVSLSESIKQTLKNLSFRKLYISGHSLGGALSSICALDCHINLSIPEKDIIVYTFASPRVGDFSFSQYYNSKFKSNSFRIINDDDLIPDLPPHILGYKNLDNLVLLQKDKCIISAEKNTEKSFFEVPNLAHHKLETYLLLLSDLKEEDCIYND